LEIDMSKSKVVCVGIALAAGALIAMSNSAWAQKKVRYETAFARCKSELNAKFPANEPEASARYSAGAACMRRYGYRLKRGAKM
jgi:hypothetical protein